MKMSDEDGAALLARLNNNPAYLAALAAADAEGAPTGEGLSIEDIKALFDKYR